MASNPRPPLLAVIVATAALALVAGGCTGEDATPLDPANPPVTTGLTDVSHSLPPTPEMRTEAERQCLEDHDLDEGYIRAVDPATDAVLSEITVDCAEVRTGG